MTPADANYLAYVLLLFLVLPFVAHFGRGGVFVGAVVVFYAWAFGEIWVRASGEEAPAAFYLLMDTMIATWFLFREGRGSMLFGLTYVAQVALHIWRLMGFPTAGTYWWAQSASSYVQVGVLVGWCWWQRRGHQCRSHRA